VFPCWTTPTGQHTAWDLGLLDIILRSVVPLFFVRALGYLVGWLRDMPV
jgi:hypothetical protein